MAVDLPHLTGQIPHDAEQAILRLREAIEGVQAKVSTLGLTVAGLPVPLTLAQIQQALSSGGASPLNTTALLNTTPPPTTGQPPGQPAPGQTTQNAYGDTCPDGTEVTCTAPTGTASPSIQFGNDAPITLTVGLRYLRAMSGGFTTLAIGSGTDGNIYTVDRSGTITNKGPGFGANNVALRTDGTPVWQDTGTTYQVGGSSNPIPAPFSGTTNGFLNLDGGGNPIWTDAQLSSPVVFKSVTLNIASQSGDWWVGVADGGAQYLAYKVSTDVLYVAGSTLGSPSAPHPTQLSDGSLILSASTPVLFLASSGYFVYGQAPSPGAGDQIDMGSAIILNSPTDLATWAITSAIQSVTFLANEFPVVFDAQSGAGQWPQSPFEPGGDPAVQYTLGMCLNIGGQWYCSAVVQFWYGRDLSATGPPSQVSQLWFYDSRWGPMAGHQPADGEMVGLFAAQGNCRGVTTSISAVNERTNVVLVPWNNEGGTSFNF